MSEIPIPLGGQVRQVEAIANGTVIDHLPPAITLRVAQLLTQGEEEVLIGLNFRSRLMGRKGVVKISGKELTPAVLSRLALFAPDATMSIIRNYQVVSKGKVPVPASFRGIARCPNPNCITNSEPCTTHFDVVSSAPLLVRCLFCERSFISHELDLD